MYDSCVMYLLKIIEYNPTKVHLNFPFVIRFKIIHLPINIQKLNKIPFYQYVHNSLFNKKDRNTRNLGIVIFLFVFLIVNIYRMSKKITIWYKLLTSFKFSSRRRKNAVFYSLRTEVLKLHNQWPVTAVCYVGDKSTPFSKPSPRRLRSLPDWSRYLFIAFPHPVSIHGRCLIKQLLS